jgi:hypothetical protein
VASSDPSVFREGAWGFWLQQAVEKALKAWLLHLGEDEPPLTHDLRRLLRLLAARGAVASEWNDLGVLTVYAVQFRYDVDPTPLELDRAVSNQRVTTLVLRAEHLLRQASPPPRT